MRPIEMFDMSSAFQSSPLVISSFNSSVGRIEFGVTP